MEELNWRDRLSQDMRPDREQPGYYLGRFVEFLKRENRLLDTRDGLHQHVAEVETYIRLYIQAYPTSPDALIRRAPDYYSDGGLKSVLARLRNAYRRFYEAFYG